MTLALFLVAPVVLVIVVILVRRQMSQKDRTVQNINRTLDQMIEKTKSK